MRLTSSEKKQLANMKKKAVAREKNQGEMIKRTAGLRVKSQKARENLYHRAFEELNGDYKSLQDRIERLHKVEYRQAKSTFAALRKKNESKVKQVVAERNKVIEAYLNKFGKDFETLQGNPELKFALAVDQDESFIGTDLSSIVVGPHVESPELEYEDRMDINYRSVESAGGLARIYHDFFPRVWASTGDFEMTVWGQVRQSLWLYHEPLESGRGNFQVTGIVVSMYGTGYAEERWRELCWNKLDSRAAPQTRQRINLYVSQTVPDLPHPLEARVINDHTLWWITPDFNDYVDVNLTYRLFPVTFLLASPDEGGSGIILQLDLNTYAQASDQHGWAAANFSEPVSRGIRLGCIKLIGEYLG